MTASFVYGFACNCKSNNRALIALKHISFVDMPILGFLILNRTFHIHIPLFNIEYKPWRFYLLLCGLPSLVCAIVLLFLPESPKFTFSKV